MYFGWADPQLESEDGWEYYEQVLDRWHIDCGFLSPCSWCRMFHCGGGVGTSVFDVATPLVNWVDQARLQTGFEASRVVTGKVCATRAAMRLSAGCAVQGQR